MKTTQAKAWARNQECEYVCDCCGLSDEKRNAVGDIPSLENISEADMPHLVRMCCKILPCEPFPRKRGDGHMSNVFPGMRTTCLRELWKTGMDDLTWKCWACHAHDLDVDGDRLARDHDPSRFSDTWQEHRRRANVAQQGRYIQLRTADYATDNFNNQWEECLRKGIKAQQSCQPT